MRLKGWAIDSANGKTSVVSATMRAWLERAYWWWMLRTSNVVRVQGMPFVYVSAQEDRSAHESRLCSLRLSIVSRTREVVSVSSSSHLRFMATLKAPRSAVLVHARGYVWPFPALELRNPHFLACRIMWATTYVRLSRDALARGAPRDLEAIRQTSYDAQLHFTKQFPDAQEWIGYLERHPSGM